jgi:hypothetical protein
MYSNTIMTYFLPCESERYRWSTQLPSLNSNTISLYAIGYEWKKNAERAWDILRRQRTERMQTEIKFKTSTSLHKWHLTMLGWSTVG